MTSKMQMFLRRWIIILHRDLGYFFTGVILIYSVSGIAVNHAHDWNPSFIIQREAITLDLPPLKDEITEENVRTNLEALGAIEQYQTFDFPSDKRIKIYLEDGSILATLADGKGEYETIRRRPVLYQANLLHLSPGDWWLVFSDIFAVALIVISLTGLLILKGHNGLWGRGKWFVCAGIIVPLAALIGL